MISKIYKLIKNLLQDSVVKLERKVGINGFGRIGRAIFRRILESKYFDIVVINDINPDNKNIAYQLKYDSLYGTLKKEIKPDKSGIIIEGKKIFVYHEKNIDEVPWDKHGITRIVDASGVHENTVRARNLKNRVKQVILTHSPKEEFVDKTVIMGVNENEIDIDNDLIISNSICDANAIAPVINLLDKKYGIGHGFITTLHPWLQYQNLLDGPTPSFAYPGHIYSHYSLGRASTFSLLPKPTTAVEATCRVLKGLKGKFYAFSYRVPTAAVSSSDISTKLNKKATVEEIKNLFEEEAKKQKNKIFHNNYDPLVSIDFLGMEYSAIIDHRWTELNNGNYLKLILWYDNEWGYSCRVVDLVDFLFSKEDK